MAEFYYLFSINLVSYFLCIGWWSTFFLFFIACSVNGNYFIYSLAQWKMWNFIDEISEISLKKPMKFPIHKADKLKTKSSEYLIVLVATVYQYSYLLTGQPDISVGFPATFFLKFFVVQKLAWLIWSNIEFRSVFVALSNEPFKKLNKRGEEVIHLL